VRLLNPVPNVGGRRHGSQWIQISILVPSTSEAPRDLLHEAAAREMEVVASETIIAEVIRVLRDKFTWSQEQLRQAERTMRRWCEVVTPTEHLNVVAADPDDNRIIEAAVAGECEAIITGDKDLLRLKEYAGAGNQYTQMKTKIAPHLRRDLSMANPPFSIASSDGRLPSLPWRSPFHEETLSGVITGRSPAAKRFGGDLQMAFITAGGPGAEKNTAFAREGSDANGSSLCGTLVDVFL
jgi:putative PIN family toxin of toxin-antitoxin system